MERATLVKVLRKIAEAIKRSDVTDLENFEVELKPSKGRASSAKEPPPQLGKRTELSSEEIRELLDKLAKSTTREEASEMLEKLNYTRKELEALARLRNVHVTKDDNVQRIKEKLLEAIIGSRRQ